MDFVSAEHYARHLATYIASPLKIEALVKQDWTTCPPLHDIAEWRYQHERRSRQEFAPRSFKGQEYNDNGEHWRPRSFVKPPLGCEVRQRDYINVEGSGPVEHIKLPPLPDGLFETRINIPARLIASVAEDFGLTPDELVSKSRFQTNAHARSVVIRLLFERGHSSTQIGRRLNRDHSSVLHARGMFDIYAKMNPVVGLSYERHALMMREAA
jgi:hypothetical protein